MGCSVPTLTIDGTPTPRLSLTRDVTLTLAVKKQFTSSPTVFRVVQSLASTRAELDLRLTCDDLMACDVTVASADLKANHFVPGEARVAAVDAPDGNMPLVSLEQTLRVDDPEFVFAQDVVNGEGWPLPDVPIGWQNEGVRWASTLPTTGNAQGIITRAAVDSGNYDVNSVYVVTYNAISHDFTPSSRANGVIGKSAFYSDASYLWHLSRINGPSELYNLGRIDLRDINGPDVTLRQKTPLQGPPTLLAVTPDGVSAAIADATQAVSHFSTGGAEAPTQLSSDGRAVVGLQTFQLITTPELALLNPDQIRLYDISAWQQLPASGALTALPMLGPLSTLSAADLNADGLPDLMVSSGLTVAVWAQRADHTFEVVNYLQLPGVSSPCPDNPALSIVRTVKGVGAGELDGVQGVDLLIATEDACAQSMTPLTARLFVFLHGN